MNALADAVAAVACALGDSHVRALAAAYRLAEHFSSDWAAKARHAVPAPHHAEVDRLNLAWATEPELPGIAISVALESVQSAQHSADTPVVQVVVTGPDSPAAPVRLTSEVVRQLIDQATKRVTLVSYAAYQMASVITALDAAVTRGIAVSLILESARSWTAEEEPTRTPGTALTTGPSTVASLPKRSSTRRLSLWTAVTSCSPAQT